MVSAPYKKIKNIPKNKIIFSLKIKKVYWYKKKYIKKYKKVYKKYIIFY